MPLLDHFHPPLSQQRHWDSFHCAWAEAMAVHLNRDLLPARYYAETHVTAGNRIEIDGVQEIETTDKAWTPPTPDAKAALDFSATDEFEVWVLNDEEGQRVVAAVELVSPGNKDRSANRRMFVAKCASYLQQGVSVIVVDVVTQRKGNLQAELFEFLGITPETTGQETGDLYAFACRALTEEQDAVQMEIWARLLAVGSAMPTLPVWIHPQRCVPLDLEETYRVACMNRRIAV